MRSAAGILLWGAMLSAAPAAADSAGTATGHGTLQRFIPGDPDGNTQPVSFTPRFSYAYREGSGSQQATWIVLTDKEPPLPKLQGVTDRIEARRQWCEESKASFVAVKLLANLTVDLLYLCPGDGSANTEMISTINGLDSAVVHFDTHSDTRLSGTMKGGQGSCPSESGENRYCEQTSDYKFDAPLLK